MTDFHHHHHHTSNDRIIRSQKWMARECWHLQAAGRLLAVFAVLKWKRKFLSVALDFVGKCVCVCSYDVGWVFGGNFHVCNYGNCYKYTLNHCSSSKDSTPFIILRECTRKIYSIYTFQWNAYIISIAICFDFTLMMYFFVVNRNGHMNRQFHTHAKQIKTKIINSF